MDQVEPPEPAPTWPHPDPMASPTAIPVPPNFPPPMPVAPVGGYPTSIGHPAAYGRQMKSRNPVLVWLVWPLITLGIYHFVWYYKIHSEMRDFDERRRVPTAGPVLVLVLLGWTVIAPLISYYHCGQRIGDAQRAAGMPQTVSAGLGTFLMLVFGLGSLYYQIELNKVTAVYGDVPPGTVVPLAV